MPFQRATKEGTRGRIVLMGPSGSGKTFSALRIARGMSPRGRIAVIDTERRSARKYSDQFEFDVLDLTDVTVDGYLEAFRLAAGYDVMVVDSLSHAWLQLLHEKEELDHKNPRSNSFANWGKISPKHQSFLEGLLDSPSHVIATMRTKTEYQVVNDGGKARPVRLGTGPIQRDGVEYEFDLVLELSQQHVATVLKDRTGKYQDAEIDKPDEAFGTQLAAWLDAAGPVSPRNPSPSAAPPMPSRNTPPAPRSAKPSAGVPRTY